MTETNIIKEIYGELHSAYEQIARDLEFHPADDMIHPGNGATIEIEGHVVTEVDFIQWGFKTYDCAILTACRTTRSAEENQNCNRQLKNELERRGLPYFDVAGCYREAHKDEVSVEDSFVIYDEDYPDTVDFFTQIYQLSEMYEQDCFLYKASGFDRIAFLVATNDTTRTQIGNIALAGRLTLNMEPQGAFTMMGSTCVQFDTLQKISLPLRKPTSMPGPSISCNAPSLKAGHSTNL